MKRYPPIEVGARFGRLVVTEAIHAVKKGRITCKCDCGEIRYVTADSLRSGRSSSCGCRARELRFRHGGTGTRLYACYLSMLTRCYEPGSKGYRYYGARGISVCDEWKAGFLVFKAWALASGYRDDLTIDRKDNSKGYEPGNCQWISMSENAAKKTSNRKLEAFGEVKSAADWARDPRCPVSEIVLRGRLNKGSWDPVRAITTPPGESTTSTPSARIFTAFGMSKTMTEWVKDPRCRVSRVALKDRLKRGWPIEKALLTGKLK